MQPHERGLNILCILASNCNSDARDQTVTEAWTKVREHNPIWVQCMYAKYKGKTIYSEGGKKRADQLIFTFLYLDASFWADEYLSVSAIYSST